MTAMFPAELKIRERSIRPATILAPMAGVTDTVFRRVIRELGGCGLIMTEFTSAEGLTRNEARMMHYFYYEPDEHPIAAQIFGADPKVMAAAAVLAEDLGFELNKQELDTLYHQFTALADRKKGLRNEEIIALIHQVLGQTAVADDERRREPPIDALLLLPDHLLYRRQSAAAVFARPMRTGPTGGGFAPLPGFRCRQHIDAIEIEFPESRLSQRRCIFFRCVRVHPAARDTAKFGFGR